ncbi:MAG TPA: hypothetical protein VFK78_07025 [Gemmatimonadales bacterium]|nr:hypothetical protein [Gemmatimonadales bacterium]
MRGGLAATTLAVTLAAQAAAAQAPDSAAARRRFWIRPVASLVLPGAGQLLAHEDRGAIYLAAEALVLSEFLRLSGTGRTQGNRFRDLAYLVARRGFASVRRDTVFEYYEQMERFSASGAFDTDSGPAFVPEPDATTYNGAVWLLARETFWADPNTPPDPTSPEYQRALRFYEQRAVGPEFLWSWKDAGLQWQEYRGVIAESDNAYRRAQNQLGLLLANHLVSAVDALISSRLTTALGRRADVSAALGPTSVFAVSVAF